VKVYNPWFIFSMVLILSILAMLLGFAMGQQASSDNCKRFGMFHYSGDIYSCQQVQANNIAVTEFKGAVK